VSARVTLYGKPGCHLCDDARAVIERVCAELGELYDEISILGDPALLDRFGEEIPVTFVDGRQVSFWTIDEDRLRAALTPPAALSRDFLSVESGNPLTCVTPSADSTDRKSRLKPRVG